MANDYRGILRKNVNKTIYIREKKQNRSPLVIVDISRVVLIVVHLVSLIGTRKKPSENNLVPALRLPYFFLGDA